MTQFIKTKRILLVVCRSTFWQEVHKCSPFNGRGSGDTTPAHCNIKLFAKLDSEYEKILFNRPQAYQQNSAVLVSERILLWGT